MVIIMECGAGSSRSFVSVPSIALPLTTRVSGTSKNTSRCFSAEPRMRQAGFSWTSPRDCEKFAGTRACPACEIHVRWHPSSIGKQRRVHLGRAETRGSRQQHASWGEFGEISSNKRCSFILRVRKQRWSRPCVSPCGESPLDGVSTSVWCKQASDPTSLPLPKLSHGHQLEKIKFWIIRADSTTDLLAAASLRAQLFYSYPHFDYYATEDLEGVKLRLKHELYVRDLMKARVKSEHERDAKMQNMKMNVKSLLAVCEESSARLIHPSTGETDSPCLIAPPTLSSPAFTSKQLVAIGTLDIQDGTGTEATVDVNTVTFQLFNATETYRKKYSKRRQISDPGRAASLANSLGKKTFTRHGYIFNLCVLENARRQGVATALMREAERVGKDMELRTLYVHVDEDNLSALSLYQNLGYIIEQQEPVEVIKRFQRPRRILLSYRL